MGLMLITNKNDRDLPELRESAVATLTVLVECCGREVVDKITDGVSTVAQSGVAGERQATVLLFSCLCNYPDRADIENRFRAGFVHFYKLVEDSELVVVKNTLSGLSTLA
jgi:hypothetical protein